ncbi:hypothetical protein MNBD_GAMMA22-1389 [hydrothermal vent metagenome]|uniref:DUF2914 domain-containing protein n=1 Tax=hydrothermal vent metagenome TaxID=652676 RepID=A0A3B1AG69_9ZZZZ
MKNFLSIVISLFFILNVSAETKILDTNTSDMIPIPKVETVESEPQVIGTQVTGQAEIKPTQNEQSGFSQGSVTRSIFTTQVSEHEPTDKIDKLQSSYNSVYYFTELQDMSGQTAIHRWEYNGNVMAETKFTVSGPRWRVWSSKNLLPSWTGEWKVSVINGVGDVISEDVFSYVTEVAVSPEVSTQQNNDMNTENVNP